jgi:hypothetical protein
MTLMPLTLFLFTAGREGPTIAPEHQAAVAPERQAKTAPAEEQQWQPWDDNGTEGWFAPEPKYDDGMTPAPWEDAFTFFRSPAGSLGWIVANGDSLEFEKAPGQPIRFKGLTTHAFTCPPEKAAAYANILRKYGFNEVRFHSLCEGLLKKEGGLSVSSPSGTTSVYTLPELDLDRMRMFDKYFAELKRAGIYVRLSGNYATYWSPSTGVHEPEKIPRLNNIAYFFDEKHQELYLKSLVLFLDHTNPYTGLRYADDPACNMYMMVNETSLFWSDARLLPEYYRSELQEKYNAWLTEKYGDDAALMKAWQAPGQETSLGAGESLSDGSVVVMGPRGVAGAEEKDRKRGADEMRFYYKLETDWFGKVRRAIRETGSKMLVQSTSWNGPAALQEMQSASEAALDFTGKHVYWLGGGAGLRRGGIRMANEPVERHPNDHLLLLCYQHVADKPFNITEWNFCYPNDYTTEAAVFMAAYGALQNVQANHRFDADVPEFVAMKEDSFSMFASPAGIAVEPLAYFLYVRGDLRPAPIIRQDALTEVELFDPFRGRQERGRRGGGYFPYLGGQPGPWDSMLVGGVRLSFDPTKYPAIWNQKAYDAGHDAQAGTITSVTGELVWNTRGEFVQAQTPKTRCLMGALQGKHENGPLMMDLSRAYGVAGMASLDDRTLETSQRILLTLAGRDRNTGQTIEAAMAGDQPASGRRGRYRLEALGGPPIIEEPVTVDFSLKTEHNGTWTVLPVDVCGRPLADRQRTLTAADGVLTGKICTRDDKALNYILTVK